MYSKVKFEDTIDDTIWDCFSPYLH